MINLSITYKIPDRFLKICRGSICFKHIKFQLSVGAPRANTVCPYRGLGDFSAKDISPCRSLSFFAYANSLMRAMMARNSAVSRMGAQMRLPNLPESSFAHLVAPSVSFSYCTQLMGREV